MQHGIQTRSHPHHPHALHGPWRVYNTLCNRSCMPQAEQWPWEGMHSSASHFRSTIPPWHLNGDLVRKLSGNSIIFPMLYSYGDESSTAIMVPTVRVIPSPAALDKWTNRAVNIQTRQAHRNLGTWKSTSISEWLVTMPSTRWVTMSALTCPRKDM